MVANVTTTGFSNEIKILCWNNGRHRENLPERMSESF
jgi:hypothetical protein